MTREAIGKAIRKARKAQGLTQGELALTANTATRFISDLENSKATCEIGKANQSSIFQRRPLRIIAAAVHLIANHALTSYSPYR